MKQKPYKIGIVAGEASGDQLGAGLIQSLKVIYPKATFVGLGGPKMLAQGFDTLFPMDRLSVMGLIEPLKRLPELFKIRKSLYKHFTKNNFDLVVGIDSPDFNLGLERRLHDFGIKTAHYVSPSVWAWRQGRVKKIARAVDLMLTLLPFEEAFYQNYQIPVVCVGHPLAEQLPLQVDTALAKQQRGLSDKPVLTIMPGSRASEVEKLGSLFFDVAQQCVDQIPNLQLLIPAANSDRKRQLEAILKNYASLPYQLLDGDSLQAMSAADVVLLSSGTSALEAMLLKKPMVVSYRLGRLTFAIISRMFKVPYVSLPNLLADEPLVPELLEDQATVENLTASVLTYFRQPEKVAALQQRFTELHQSLQYGGSNTAAQALAKLIEQ